MKKASYTDRHTPSIEISDMYHNRHKYPGQPGYGASLQDAMLGSFEAHCHVNPTDERAKKIACGTVSREYQNLNEQVAKAASEYTG
jgi:hypothetical protein